MKVLVAMDEFNGIISSYQANRYVEEAVASQIEKADIVQVPLFNGRHELMDSVFLWQSGTKYRGLVWVKSLLMRLKMMQTILLYH